MNHDQIESTEEESPNKMFSIIVGGIIAIVVVVLLALYFSH
ncbi:hypothetical protein [Dictyobacter arantiisoli]|nr:hypothetical protein [Dictyobacter arantiisoli]